MAEETVLKIITEDGSDVGTVNFPNTSTVTGGGGYGQQAGGAQFGAVGGAPAVLGGVVGGIAAAGTLLINAFNTVKEGLDDLEDSLAPFSGDISGARANIRIKEIEATIDRADRLGPQLADFATAKGNFGIAFEELKISFMKPLISVMTKILEFLEPFVKGMSTWMDAIIGLFKDLLAVVYDGISEIIDLFDGFGKGDLAQTYADWADWLRREKNKDNKEQNDFLDRIMQELRNELLDPNLAPGALPIQNFPVEPPPRFL